MLLLARDSTRQSIWWVESHRLCWDSAVGVRNGNCLISVNICFQEFD